MSYAATTQLSRPIWGRTKRSMMRSRRFAKRATRKRMRQAVKRNLENAPKKLPYSYWADVWY